MRLNLKTYTGFTLAELLIALLILAVIATFTIPKVLVAQSSVKNKAAAKEVAAMMSDAYQQYKLSNGSLNANMKASDLTPYLNYVRLDTTTIIDDIPNQSTFLGCTSSDVCLRMHSGAIVWLWGVSFGGTNNTNAICFVVDPDNTVAGGTADGPSKSVSFFLYTTGRLTTDGNKQANTTTSYGVEGAAASNRDPSWFSWN